MAARKNGSAPAEPPEKAPEDEPPPPPDGVERFPNGWSLANHETWQISVGPDGLLMLPRHLAPSEVADFCAAAQVAAEEGLLKIAWNNAHTTPMPVLTGTPQRAIVTEAGQPLPPGAVPMTVREGPNRAPQPQGSIGRRNRGSRNPQTNPAAMPGMPRNARRR